MILIRYIVVTFLLFCGVNGSFVSWLFGSKTSSESDGNEADASQQGGSVQPGSIGRVPFEMKSAEQRFLKAGEVYLAGLSELDTCHHRVIAELETSCSDISEEELGKLGVSLLNCQSQSEGRPTYTCTKDMTLAECTSAMDATTWNTYHIISDRSRSVCYGVRQQQFQRQTRYAVNQLAATATDQLNVMENLKEGQSALHSATTDTLKMMSDGQQEMLNRQEVLKDSQGELQATVQGNLKDLTSEKALIAAGHKELASMTDNIRQQLDNATKQLLNQDQDLKRNHKDLQRDLASIRLKAKEVWKKLDGDMDRVAIYQDETFRYYKETIDNLKRMNDTINYLLNLVNDMQTGIDERLGWLSTLVGGVGENLNVLTTCISHCAYFLLASLCVTFLHTPTFSRIVLLLLVPLNAISEIKNGSSLDFSGLTILIVGVVLANWTVLLFMRNWRNKPLFVGAKSPQSYVAKTPCLCDHISPQFSLPPVVNRSPLSKSLADFSDDEDYLPTDLSEITGETSSYSTFNSGVMSESSNVFNDTTLTNVTDLGLASFIEKNDVRTTPASSTTVKTPMPTSPSVLGFGDLNHTNPARRHLATTLDSLPKQTPSPRSWREGTPTSSRPGTPSSSRPSTPGGSHSRPSTPGKRLCSGTTKSGQPCRMACVQGAEFCFRHGEK